MKTLYIVKSGQYDGNIGMTIWDNIRAYADRDAAEAWIKSEKKRDKSFNEDLDFLEIDEVTLYE
jgi:hypothetical protein